MDDQQREWLTRQGGISEQLHRLRAGMSGKELAERLGWSESKISRIQNGHTRPSPDDLAAWVSATNGPDAALGELLLALEQFDTARRDWRRRMNGGITPVQAAHTDLAASATVIRYCDTAYIPGFLQTPEYARRVFDEFFTRCNPEVDDLDQAVRERMNRQRMLYDPAKRFEFLMTEAVLRTPLISPAAMRAQLDRLQTAIGLPNVRFGILPLDRVMPTATPSTTFQMYDDVAMVETAVGEEEQRGGKAAMLAGLMDDLWGYAVEGEEARRVIIAAADALPPA